MVTNTRGDADRDEAEYSSRLGERIRLIRRQKRLSLQDVEARSESEFKASVLGAYERGERAVSMPRLHRRSEERRVGKECRSRWSPYH